MSQIMVHLVLKFSRCCCHSTRGSSGTNLTYTIKLIPPKRVVWCINCGSILFRSRVIANILLKFTNFCYHDNKVNLQNTQFGAKKLGPILNLSGFIVSIVCKFTDFSYHSNRGWSDTFRLRS